VDLRHTAGKVAREHTSLETVLAQRTRRRLVWAAGGVVSLLFVFHAGKLLIQGFEHNRTTDPTKLARFGAEVGVFDRSNHFPAGSPDGRVAFVELAAPDTTADAALRVVSPGRAGSVPGAGVVVARGQALRDPAWIGGSALLYVVTLTEHRAALRRVEVPGGSATELHAAEDIESPSASQDGRRIAFAERRGDAWQITLLDAGQRRSIGEGRMPDLHRLGKRLAFIRVLDGLPKPFVLDLDRASAEPRPLFTPDRFRYADPTWAPCSAFVALATNQGWDETRTGTELETWNVVAVDTRRGGSYALTFGNAAARRLSWAGQRIYFETDGRPSRLSAVYPLEPHNEFFYGPYARSCR
jgi:hypothetical protein